MTQLTRRQAIIGASVITVSETHPVVRAAQLPAAIATFSGRTAEIDRLDRWLADGGDGG